MAVTVNMFNANNLPLNVNVNNAGSTFQIAAAAGPNWTPQTPATNPTFNPGPPTPGNLGIGTNSLSLTPQGSTTPFIAQVNIPSAVNWSSIQIYLFFAGYTSCSWVVLNAGQLISQGSGLSEQTMKKMK